MKYDPKPRMESVVVVGKARFTLLSAYIIRMEWGGRNDAATFAFINRYTPTPPHSVFREGNWTVIKTSAITVSGLC